MAQDSNVSHDSIDSIEKMRIVHKEKNKLTSPHFYYARPDDPHQNPYHRRLGNFEDFVLRDADAEKYRHSWNELVFKRNAPLHVEIGSGSGHFMQDFCMQSPEINFVGLDFRFKRSFQTAKRLSKIPHKNFRYLRAWAERLEFIFGENEIDHLYYFFPDPWPKSRHHKKRLIQNDFVEKIYQLIRPGGMVFIKTDHDDYFEWMNQVFCQYSHLFSLQMRSKDLKEEFPEHFLSSFETEFEKIFIKQGIKIKALILKSNKPPLLSGI